jgi:hypothetical protein
MSGHTQAEIGQLTQLLRASDDPFWRRLRQLLTAKHIDLSSTLVVQCFPDDQDFEFGIIVTKPRSVFQFGLEYLHRSVEDGTIH